MGTVPALWHGYGVCRIRPDGRISWVRVDHDPRWLQWFVTDTDTAIVPIRVMPCDASQPNVWWGAWDVAKARWAFVAPSRTALGTYFPVDLSYYVADGTYVFSPIRIEDATTKT